MKMQFIRLISLIVAIVLLICALPLYSVAAENSGYTYIMPQKYSGIVIGSKYIYFELDGKWGRADLNGTIVTEPIYSSYSDILNKSADVKKRSSYSVYRAENGKYGYKNADGDIVVAAKYDIVSTIFDNGSAIVCLNGKYGIIDTSGKPLVDTIYDTLHKNDTSDNYAYSIDGKYGFLDKNYNVLCDTFLRANNVVMYEDYIVYQVQGGKYGIAGYDGSILSSAVWDYMRDFHYGLAAVGVNEDFYGINTRWGYINKQGEIVIPAIYDCYNTDSLDFSEGLAGVCEGEYGYYIDTSGETVLKLSKNVYPYQGFSNGIAVVDYSFDKKFIDHTGRVLFESNGKNWYDASALYVDLAAVYSFSDDMKSVLCGVIKYTGNSPSSWALTEVNSAIKLGIIPETLQNLYQSAMTRAEYCKLAIALIEKYTGSDISVLTEKSPTNTFSDTADEDVLYSHALGIVQGRGNSIFDPKGIISRQEAAKILVNTFDVCAYLPSHSESEPAYNDRSSIAGWARSGVWYLADWKVMIGVGNNNFDPSGRYTREQSILTMVRLYNVMLQNAPQKMYIRPAISVFNGEITDKYTPRNDCMVEIEIPADWSYDYNDQTFTYEGREVARLSNAEYYLGGVPLKISAELTDCVYRSSGSMLVELTFSDDVDSDIADRIADTFRLYDRKKPPVSDLTLGAHMEYVYTMACEAMSWFMISNLYERNSVDNIVARYENPTAEKSGPVVETYYEGESGMTPVKDSLITNYKALDEYLSTLFSDEIVSSLFSQAIYYRDIGGELYGVGAARGTDITKGGATYKYERVSETKILYKVTVELIDYTLKNVTGSETYTYTYEKIGGDWVWTDFSLYY